MFVFDYIYGKSNETVKKSDNINQNTSTSINTKPIKIIIPKIKKSNIVYLITNKGSDAILGVCDSLQEAKTKGISATNNNCIIIELGMNDNCQHLHRTAYESK